MTIRGFAILTALLLTIVGAASAAGANGQWIAFNTQFGEQKLTGKYTPSSGGGMITEGKVSGSALKIKRKVADVATQEGVAKRVS